MTEESKKPPQTPPATRDEKASSQTEDALTWLENLAAKHGKSVEELASIDLGSAYESPFRGLIDNTDEELPDWLRELPKSDFNGQTTEQESRLDWLAKMTEREAVEELPTLRWRGAPPESLEDVAAAAAVVAAATAGKGSDPAAESELHVETFAAEQPVATAATLPDDRQATTEIPPEPVVVETATIDFGPDADADVSVAEVAYGSAPPGPDLEDLDEAMAWLEELAISQETPLQDLPSVADRALASKLMGETPTPTPPEPMKPTTSLPASETELEAMHEAPDTYPESLDEAIAYLDRLAAGGSDPNIGSTRKRSDVSSNLEAALNRMDALALPAGIGLADIAALFTRDGESALPRAFSLEASLDWLQEQLGGSGAAEPAARAAAAAGTAAHADALDERLIALSAEMPEDPDQALAWLESLAPTTEGDAATVVLGTAAIEPVSEAVTPYLPETAAIDAMTLDEATLLEIPDDPDQAIAWMEELARREQQAKSPPAKQSSKTKKTEAPATAETVPLEEKPTETQAKAKRSRAKKAAAVTAAAVAIEAVGSEPEPATKSKKKKPAPPASAVEEVSPSAETKPASRSRSKKAKTAGEVEAAVAATETIATETVAKETVVTEAVATEAVEAPSTPESKSTGRSKSKKAKTAKEPTPATSDSATKPEPKLATRSKGKKTSPDVSAAATIETPSAESVEQPPKKTSRSRSKKTAAATAEPGEAPDAPVDQSAGAAVDA